MTDEQDVLLRDEKVRVQSEAGSSRRSTRVLSQSNRRATTVREFLLAQYEQAIESDRIEHFENKLRRALNKIPPVKAAVE